MTVLRENLGVPRPVSGPTGNPRQRLARTISEVTNADSTINQSLGFQTFFRSWRKSYRMSSGSSIPALHESEVVP